MYQLIFRLPYLPPMGNVWGRINSFKRDKMNKQLYTIINAQACGLKPSAPLDRYRLILTRFSSSEPDYDGLVMSFKGIVDGLVQAKVLANDKLSNSGIWDVRWVKSKPKEGSIKVEVYAVPSA